MGGLRVPLSGGAVAWVVQLDECSGSIWTRALVAAGQPGRRIVNMGGVLPGNGLVETISGMVQLDQGSGSNWTRRPVGPVLRPGSTGRRQPKVKAKALVPGASSIRIRPDRAPGSCSSR